MFSWPTTVAGVMSPMRRPASPPLYVLPASASFGVPPVCSASTVVWRIQRIGFGAFGEAMTALYEGPAHPNAVNGPRLPDG